MTESVMMLVNDLFILVIIVATLYFSVKGEWLYVS